MTNVLHFLLVSCASRHHPLTGSWGRDYMVVPMLGPRGPGLIRPTGTVTVSRPDLILDLHRRRNGSLVLFSAELQAFGEAVFVPPPKGITAALGPTLQRGVEAMDHEGPAWIETVHEVDEAEFAPLQRRWEVLVERSTMGVGRWTNSQCELDLLAEEERQLTDQAAKMSPDELQRFMPVPLPPHLA